MVERACDTLIDAPWLLPIAPENVAHERSAVAIRDGRIVDVGETSTLETRWRADERVRLPHHVLLPGLVNAHGHAAMTLLRGIAEDLPLQEWLTQVIWPLEARHAGASFVADGTALALLEMLQSGTTTFSDMYFFPESVGAATRGAGMRCQLASPVVDFENAWSRDAHAAISQGLELHDAYRGDPHVHVAFGPHAPYTVSEEALGKVWMYAEELDLQIHMHLHENAQELADANTAIGTTWIARLDQLGYLSPRVQAVHVTQVNDRDFETLARTDTRLVHCPRSNSKLASGVCPVARLQGAGATVGLGTDGAASNNSLDLLGEARTAALLSKLTNGDAASLDAPTALYMATLGGAEALALAEDIGSLEPGKWADLIAIDTNDATMTPLHDPFAALVHGASGGLVTDVWVGGARLLESGRPTTLDSERILANARQWRSTLAT